MNLSISGKRNARNGGAIDNSLDGYRMLRGNFQRGGERGGSLQTHITATKWLILQRKI